MKLQCSIKFIALISFTILVSIVACDTPRESRGIMDTTKPIEQRINIIDKLLEENYSDFLDVAPSLMQGNDEQVAEYVANLLVNSVVMIGSHGDHMLDAGTPTPKHDMSFVNKVHTLLKGEIGNRHVSVRDIAVKYLVSLGEKDTLKKIAELVQQKQISDNEALEYYMVADEEGIEYIKHYAEIDSEHLSSVAISFLSSNEDQQSYVKEKILSNEDRTTYARSVALEYLAKYDDNFVNYSTQPEIILFALDVDSLPGDVSKSGTDLVSESFVAAVKENPSNVTHYKRSIDRSAQILKEEGSLEKAQTLQNLNIEIF